MPGAVKCHVFEKMSQTVFAVLFQYGSDVLYELDADLAGLKIGMLDVLGHSVFQLPVAQAFHDRLGKEGGREK